MGHEIAHGDLSRPERIHDREIRVSPEVRVDRLVERQRALLDQLHCRGRRVRLRHRAGSEDRPRSHPCLAAQRGVAEAFFPDDGPVPSDGDLDAAHAVRLHDVARVLSRGRNEPCVFVGFLRGGKACAGHQGRRNDRRTDELPHRTPRLMMSCCSISRTLNHQPSSFSTSSSLDSLPAGRVE